jgi:hypothetical protein
MSVLSHAPLIGYRQNDRSLWLPTNLSSCHSSAPTSYMKVRNLRKPVCCSTGPHILKGFQIQKRKITHKKTSVL